MEIFCFDVWSNNYGLTKETMDILNNETLTNKNDLIELNENDIKEIGISSMGQRLLYIKPHTRILSDMQNPTCNSNNPVHEFLHESADQAMSKDK